VNRLAGRLARLEQKRGGCPGCADRPPLLELVTPDGREIPGHDQDSGPCPDCGQPRELLTVVFRFDPRAAKEPA
jgi:hypothetical protein